MVQLDTSSPTGWTATTTTSTNVSIAAAPPPAAPNPIPPFGALGGGAVLAPPNGRLGTINIGGGSGVPGGYTVYYTPGLFGGTSVQIVGSDGVVVTISSAGISVQRPGVPTEYFPPQQ